MIFLFISCTSSTTDTSEVKEPEEGSLQGDYAFTMGVAPVNGLPVTFLASMDSIIEDGVESFWADLRPVSADGEPGEISGSIEKTVLNSDGTFAITVERLLWPEDYTPTGGDIEVEGTFSGTTLEDGRMCGEVEGSIITFEMDLDGSTFGVEPWEGRSQEAFKQCPDTQQDDWTPIETCPILVQGRNTEFLSGGKSREVELIIPETYDATQPIPLVFAWHGITANIQNMIDGGDLRTQAEEYGVIFAVPQGESIGGVPGWDPFTGEGVNKDLLFFDDLHQCITEQFSIDEQRIYTTGISNGGLLTGVLMVERSGILAAAAPISGGINIPYADVTRTIPTLVYWGGEGDSAFEQDFHGMSLEMIDTLSEAGHPLITCNHNTGHNIQPSYFNDIMPYLLNHTLESSTLAYDELITDFSSYCSIP